MAGPRQHYALLDLNAYDPSPAHSGSESRFLCVECGHTKGRDRAHRSLAVNIKTGAYICHRCNLRGKLKDFWTERPPLNRRQIASFSLRQKFVVEPKPDETEKRAALDGAEWLMWWAAAQPVAETPGATYLAERCLSADVAHEAGVRYSSMWYGRPAVLFPIHDKSGLLVAVNGRFVDGRTTPKTQTAGSKSLGVFATPGVLSQPPIAVCEGAMDALALWSCGVSAVALVGTSWPEWLPRALAFKPVLNALDSDEAGDSAAARLLTELQARGSRVFRLRARSAKDWAEALESYGAERLRTHLLPFSEIADDEVRVEAAQLSMQKGSKATAEFIAWLVADAHVRQTLLEWVHREFEPLVQRDYAPPVRVDPPAPPVGASTHWQPPAEFLDRSKAIFG